MEQLSPDILKQFNALLDKKAIPAALHDEYRKWLRYFLDYCAKYPPPEQRSAQVRSFTEKLRSKGAPGAALHQAAHALSLYYLLQPRLALYHQIHSMPAAASVTQPVPPMPDAAIEPICARSIAAEAPNAAPVEKPARWAGKKYNEWWSLEQTRSPEWDEVVIGELTGEIKARHYLSSKMKRLRASILKV
jgi:hypothetical protein